MRYSDITDYYTTINVARARALAARHAAVIAGLDAMDRVVPPDAEVMWVRPEYVAVLGERRGVPWYHGQDRAELARMIHEKGVDYVVVAKLFKTDVGGGNRAPIAIDDLNAYAHPFLVFEGAGDQDFVLLEVDHARLARAAGASG